MALADSELPQMAKSAKVDAMTEEEPRGSRGRWLANNVGQEVARKLGDWKVSLTKADGLDTLHMSLE